MNGEKKKKVIQVLLHSIHSMVNTVPFFVNVIVVVLYRVPKSIRRVAYLLEQDQNRSVKKVTNYRGRGEF